jgi:hypothetical protein
MADFARAASSASVTGDWLHLPPGNLILDGSVIFVREVYRALEVELERLALDRGKAKFVITGNPGIGKSYFGYYMLIR